MLIYIDQQFFSLPIIYRVLISVFAISLIGATAYKLKQLTISGLIAAFVMGFLSLFLGGTSALMMYLFFLISAAFIGKLSKKVRGINKIQKKGGKRDYMQVLANGLPALISIILYRLTTNSIFLIVFTASLAEACADTWGGDIGVLSKDDPISIVSGKRVEKGLSGGISLLGCAASMLASVLYAIFYYSTFNANLSGALLVASSGFAGCLIDSVLGGTIQVHYLDEKSGKLTEKEIDENGKKRRAVRGIKFFDNDIVNLTSNIFSAILALSIGLLLHI